MPGQVVDTVLIAGWTFVLILMVGQMLVRRRTSANRVLFWLFVVTLTWLAHAIGFRLGMIERVPHLNKVYLPLLGVTGALWYAYVRRLHDVAAGEPFERRWLIPSLACLLLSIPFHLQDAAFKRDYVEVEVSDVPTATMYAATRLAELTLIAFLVLSLRFLAAVRERTVSGRGVGTSRALRLFTVVALAAATVRLFGSIAGDHTVSVLVPCLMAMGVFVGMHFLSYREPVVLNLDHAARLIRTRPDGDDALARHAERLREERWFLDPDLKLQGLARRLGTPPAELSALINGATGGNFNEFVNGFRVEHAKSLLVERPDMPVIDVAHASGFNSKSTFYARFSSRIGMTPARFREEHVRAASESGTGGGVEESG